MEWHNLIFVLLIILMSIPSGLVLAWLTRDELIQGRRWFKIAAAFFLAIGILFLILGNYAISLTGFFMGIVSFISYRKSFDRKWTGKS